MTPRRSAAALLLALAGPLAAAGPAAAQVISKSKEGAFKGTGAELPLLFGVGIEYRSDSESSEVDCPVALEYNLTDELKLTLEWSYVSIHSTSDAVESASGLGDLETFVELEFLRERRYRPALTAEVGVKWPTANRKLGTREPDYSAGLIASKEIAPFELDLGVVYTYIGSPPGVHLDDTTEISLAAQRRLTHIFDVEAELLYTIGGGGSFRGQAGTVGGFAGSAVGGGGSDFEATLGLAEHFTDWLKLEEGVVLTPDGSWQLVTFLEFDFSGGR